MDNRYLQRLQNLEKAFYNLEQGLLIAKPDILQRAGIIQFFEMSFELSWNTMKDYLEEQGFLDVATPRKAVKKSFEIGLITDGTSWLKGLEDRNLTTHTYNEETALEVVRLIRDEYAPLISEFLSEIKKNSI